MRFADVVGQEALKEQLRARVKSGMVPHANLFLGPQGSGNFALAMAFARYACCPNRDELDACGKCDVCKKFDTLQYADLHFSFPVYKASSTSKGASSEYMKEWRSFLLGEEGSGFNAYPTPQGWIEKLDAEKKTLQILDAEAGEISARLALRSYEGRYNIQVIWLPESMRNEAANKLLKLIEEPPDQTLFLLISHATENILPTILSRTQLVQVPRIADEDLEAALRERLGMESSYAHDLAHFVEGDYSKALDIARNTDGNSAFLERFRAWMRACYKRDAMRLVDFAAELGGGSRDSQKQFISYTLHFVRQCIVNNYGEHELARFTSEEADFATRFAPFIHHRNVIQINELLNEAYHDISRNVSGKVVFLDLSLKLHSELHRKLN